MAKQEGKAEEKSLPFSLGVRIGFFFHRLKDRAV